MFPSITDGQKNSIPKKTSEKPLKNGQRAYKSPKQVVKIIKRVKEMKIVALEERERPFYLKMFSRPCIVQKYIENPFLIYQQKFHLRCFVLLASSNPLLGFYHPGYVQLASQQFDMGQYGGK
jgi:hypothetical protein